MPEHICLFSLSLSPNICYKYKANVSLRKITLIFKKKEPGNTFAILWVIFHFCQSTAVCQILIENNKWSDTSSQISGPISVKYWQKRVRKSILKCSDTGAFKYGCTGSWHGACSGDWRCQLSVCHYSTATTTGLWTIQTDTTIHHH